MKSAWSSEARQELANRITKLEVNNSRKWGKMTAAQMLRHLSESLRMVTGELKPAPKGGPMKLWPIRKAVIYWLPWPQGAPTAPELIPADVNEFEAEKARTLEMLEKMKEYGQKDRLPPHPAFGDLTTADWGALIHRHFDHHLKQFSA